MNESQQIDIIDAISADLHQSIDDLFDIIKKQKNDITKLTAELANRKTGF